jgi:RNA polymerase sigma-70 factor (ECF subfamily)
MKADDATLAQLMRLSQKGDRQAYSALLKASRTWLQRYFARKVAPCQLDDLVQDTLLAVHRKLASYDPSRPFLPWLAAIARYRWVDHLRLAYRMEAVELADDLPALDEQDGISARISLQGLFELLPPAQAQVIALVRIEGRTVAEASLRSGQSEPLVKVNIHRGLKKLSALIEKAR